ncbi:MAG: ATP-binding protein, partial [Haloplanus sp.]
GKSTNSSYEKVLTATDERQRKNGERYVVDQTIVPAKGPDGEIERFVAVNHEITELKELQETLRERSEQLQILNRVLRHDIRNDMAVVLGWVEHLTENVGTELASAVNRIESSAGHAVELTTVARDIAKAMTSNDTPDLKAVSLTDTLLEVGESCQESFESATIELPDSPPQVTVEANELLSSVFRNLITNAVQHNDADQPVVSVTLREADGRACVRVEDNGPGVPDRLQDEIFQDDVKGLESSGTGMGLYLVSTLVDMYDGDVWAEDNDPTGAVFCVELDTVAVTRSSAGETQ